MTVEKLSKALQLTPLTSCTQSAQLKVTGCYIGDLLSWVMGRAQEDSAWITVMGNINAIAVAKLADLSCIILCDGAPLDGDAKKQAEQSDIAIFSSSLPAYQLALQIAVLLGDSPH